MHIPVLIRPVLLAMILVTVGCGGSPTGPSNTADFQGVWQGNWQRASCSGAGCDVVPASGGLRVTLTQSGTEVQGSVEVVSFVIPASGSVNSGGTLSLSGVGRSTVIVNGVPQSASGTLSNWSTTRSGNTMNGGFTITVVPDNPGIGSQVVQLTLQNVTKSS